MTGDISNGSSGTTETGSCVISQLELSFLEKLVSLWMTLKFREWLSNWLVTLVFFCGGYFTLDYVESVTEEVKSIELGVPEQMPLVVYTGLNKFAVMEHVVTSHLR